MGRTKMIANVPSGMVPGGVAATVAGAGSGPIGALGSFLFYVVPMAVVAWILNAWFTQNTSRANFQQLTQAAQASGQLPALIRAQVGAGRGNLDDTISDGIKILFVAGALTVVGVGAVVAFKHSRKAA